MGRKCTGSGIREDGKQVPQDCRKLEKWGKLNLRNLFQSKKGKEAGVNKNLKGIGIQRYGKQAPTTLWDKFLIHKVDLNTFS